MTLINNQWYLAVDGWKNAHVYFVIDVHHSGDKYPVGPLPTVSKGTHATILLVNSLKEKRWEAKMVEQSSNKVKLSVNSPASAVCGQYGLTVTCGSVKGEATTTHDCSKNIVMLFNPWCEGELGRGCRHGS